MSPRDRSLRLLSLGEFNNALTNLGSLGPDGLEAPEASDLEEIAEEFGGETPTQPSHREALDDGKKRLGELHRAAQSYVEPFGLPGPAKQEMEHVGEFIRREGEPWR